MAVIVTPHAYYEVLTKVPAQLPGDGGYLDFWRAYLQGGRYCRGDDCMVVPTWNHLWFLPYLWVYAVLGAGVVTAARVVCGALTWWAIVACCGWAQRAFTRESPALRAAGGHGVQFSGNGVNSGLAMRTGVTSRRTLSTV